MSYFDVSGLAQVMGQAVAPLPNEREVTFRVTYDKERVDVLALMGIWRALKASVNTDGAEDVLRVSTTIGPSRPSIPG